MKKPSIIALAVFTIALGTTTGILYFQQQKLKKEITHLKSENSELEDDLSEAKSKIEDLTARNEDLQAEIEEQISIPHMSFPSQDGYTSNNTTYLNGGSAISTKIDGEFEGWEGETIFKMIDGSIWQQASYDYTYHYAYMPDVLIYNKSGSYYMRVEGVDDEIRVKRIK